MAFWAILSPAKIKSNKGPLSIYRISLIKRRGAYLKIALRGGGVLLIRAKHLFERGGFCLKVVLKTKTQKLAIFFYYYYITTLCDW